MKIDIWSDIVCPFCYIGKRHLEAALAKFSGRDEVEIRWHSFELDPNASNEPAPMIETLMAKYGQTREQIEAMMSRVIDMGAAAGLELRLNDTIRTNSFDAHRMMHLAAKHGKQDQASERLFRAYFTEGENISRPETLARLFEEIGIEDDEVMTTLASGTYAESVRSDQQQARELGITGVPYFVFDDKYAISGAQPPSSFLQVLQQVQAERPVAVSTLAEQRPGEDGPSCS